MTTKRPYIAAGIDMQGRHPQAAEACSDIGADADGDPLACATGIVAWVLVSLVLWLIAAAALCAAMLP